MKKFTLLLLSLVISLTATFFLACDKKGEKEVTPVIIKVSSAEYQIGEETTLYDYMLMLKNDNKLNFTATNSDYGMFITSVNGVSNGLGDNPCWMIYTDDIAYKDTSEWGTKITVNGKEYSSATVGVSSIVVTDGCEYILNYTKF